MYRYSIQDQMERPEFGYSGWNGKKYLCIYVHSPKRSLTTQNAYFQAHIADEIVTLEANINSILLGDAASFGCQKIVCRFVENKLTSPQERYRVQGGSYPVYYLNTLHTKIKKN